MEERKIKVEQIKKSWLEEHFDQLLLCGMFAGGLTVGLIFGFDLGNRYCQKQVMKSIEKFCNGELKIPGIETKTF